MWSSNESVQKMCCCALCTLSISYCCTAHLGCVKSVLHTYGVSLVVSPLTRMIFLELNFLASLLITCEWFPVDSGEEKERKVEILSVPCAFLPGCMYAPSSISS